MRNKTPAGNEKEATAQRSATHTAPSGSPPNLQSVPPDPETAPHRPLRTEANKMWQGTQSKPKCPHPSPGWQKEHNSQQVTVPHSERTQSTRGPHAAGSRMSKHRGKALSLSTEHTRQGRPGMHTPKDMRETMTMSAPKCHGLKNQASVHARATHRSLFVRLKTIQSKSKRIRPPYSNTLAEPQAKLSKESQTLTCML